MIMGSPVTADFPYGTPSPRLSHRSPRRRFTACQGSVATSSVVLSRTVSVRHLHVGCTDEAPSARRQPISLSLTLSVRHKRGTAGTQTGTATYTRITFHQNMPSAEHNRYIMSKPGPLSSVTN